MKILVVVTDPHAITPSRPSWAVGVVHLSPRRGVAVVSRSAARGSPKAILPWANLLGSRCAAQSRSLCCPA